MGAVGKAAAFVAALASTLDALNGLGAELSRTETNQRIRAQKRRIVIPAGRIPADESNRNRQSKSTQPQGPGRQTTGPLVFS